MKGTKRSRCQLKKVPTKQASRFQVLAFEVQVLSLLLLFLLTSLPPVGSLQSLQSPRSTACRKDGPAAEEWTSVLTVLVLSRQVSCCGKTSQAELLSTKPRTACCDVGFEGCVPWQKTAAACLFRAPPPQVSLHAVHFSQSLQVSCPISTPLQQTLAQS